MSIRNDLLRDILSAIGGGGAVQWGSVGGNILAQADLQAQFADTTPANVVEVNGMGDFPAAVLGVRTLEAKTYNIGALGGLTTADRFEVADGTVIQGNSPIGTPFVYTGTGTMFTGVNANFVCDFVTLAAPAGQLFDISADIGTPITFGLNIVTIGACNKIGTFDNLRSFNVTNVNVLSCNEGIDILGKENWERMSVSKLGITTGNAACICLDLNDSKLMAAEVTNFNIIGVPGTVALSGLAGSANMVAGAEATIADSEFFGGMTSLGGGLTSNDTGFDFHTVTGVVNSKAVGHCYITVPATTDISDGVEVPIAGTFAQGAMTSQATASTEGVITMLNRIEKRGNVTTNIDVDKIGGGTDDYIVRIKKDVGGLGTTIEEVDGSAVTISLSGGGSAHVNAFAPTCFVNGDKFFVTIEGDGTNDDVDAVSQSFEVTE